MRPCKTLPKHECRPTPFVGYAEAARWISLKHCQALELKSHLSCDLQYLLKKVPSYKEFPLEPRQCLAIIECLDAQLPATAPENCCTELSFRLKESDIYLLRRWVQWMDQFLADLATPIDELTIGGAIAMKKAERLYEKLTEFRKRLAAPIHS
ncbi:hypothetical protein [Spirosoma areae]